MVTIKLPIYYTQKYKTKKDKVILVGLNTYRNMHHHQSNNIKKHYHDLVAEQVKDLKFGRIKLRYRVYVKRKGTDPHNVRSIIEKFALDGLVECGAIVDDSLEYISGIESEQWFYDKENPRMEIDIMEIK